MIPTILLKARFILYPQGQSIKKSDFVGIGFRDGTPESVGASVKIRKALKYTDVKFEFAIAQPGISADGMNNDINSFLGSVYATIVEMTETKLKCYFS